MLDYDSDANTTELTRSYYHLNALGSVMEITDANQAGVVSYRYSAYGDMTITRGGVAQAADPLAQYWGFTGRFSDEETELWYYRARLYDGATGRMLQRDPAGYSRGPNLYCYVGSRPAQSRDPTGLETAAQRRERAAAQRRERDAQHEQQLLDDDIDSYLADWGGPSTITPDGGGPAPRSPFDRLQGGLGLGDGPLGRYGLRSLLEEFPFDPFPDPWNDPGEIGKHPGADPDLPPSVGGGGGGGGPRPVGTLGNILQYFGLPPGFRFNALGFKVLVELEVTPFSKEERARITVSANW